MRNSEKNRVTVPTVAYLGRRIKKLMKIMLGLVALSTTGDN